MRFYAIASTLLGLFGISAGAETTTIAVAANFKAPVEALAETFEEESGHTVRIVVGSTGKLYAQITHGAPFDAFLAADQERPKKLVEAGYVSGNAAFTYATGILALWEPSAAESFDIERLLGDDVHHIALANPRLAPYGRAAMETLKAANLDDELRSKIVTGENVAQAFILVDTKNADIGFVSLSQIISADVPARGHYWTVPDELYAPILQDAVLLKRGEGNAAAEAFMSFLASDPAQATIECFGYKPRGK